MQWQPSPQPAVRPMSVGELIDAGFRIMKRQLVPLIKITAVFTIPVQVFSILISLSIRNGPQAFIENGSDGRQVVRWDAFRNLMTGLGLVSLLSFLMGLIVAGAITRVVAQDYFGNSVNAKESILYALRKFFPLLGAGILVVIGMFAGLVACLIPGIFLFVAWSVATPALVVEDIGPIRAMSRSMALIKPRWWPVFGLRILLLLMASIASAMLQLPVGLIFDSSSVTGVIANGVFSGIIGLFVIPFSAAIMVMLYFDARVRQEGFDLQLGLAALDFTPAPLRNATSTGEFSSEPSEQPASTQPPLAPGWGKAGTIQISPPPPPPPPPSTAQ